MLAVTIEILPGGLNDRRRTIASVRIANLTDGESDLCRYSVYALESANERAATPPRSATCCVDHDRRRSVWQILAKAALAIQEADFDEL